MARDAEMQRLEDSIAQLATAQSRTEQALQTLAEAQTRTEERVRRLEVAVERLAEAQARTELAVGNLAQQVGRLSDTIGFTLEDLAREVSPAYLVQHFGIHVDQLERRFFQLDGQEIELDFYGEGRRDGEPVAVLGEVRSRIYAADVESFARQAARLVPRLPARCHSHP